MLSKISAKDLELLSAYLDGHIDGRELAEFESRLEAERDLISAKMELEGLKFAMRDLPRIEPKRHFTLGSEFQRKPRFTNIFRDSRWGMLSAVASFLLVVVFLGEQVLVGNLYASYDPLNAESVLLVEDEIASEVLSADAAPAEADLAESQAAEASADDAAQEAPEAFAADATTGEGEVVALEESSKRGSEPIAEERAAIPTRLEYLRWAEFALGAIALISFWIAIKKR